MTATDRPTLADPREAKLQSHRIAMTKMVVLDMLGELLVLSLYAYAGTIPVWVAFAFAAAGPGSALGFLLFLKLGLNLHMPDRSMLLPQILVQLTLQLAFLLLVPQVAVVFMLALLLLSAYAVLQFTARQFIGAWAIYAVTTGLALYLVRDRFAYPGTSVLETGLLWLVFVLALRLLTLINIQIGLMRRKLSDKNRELEASLLQIEHMVSRDHLTGVASRANFMQSLDTQLQILQRTGIAFSLVMIDLDNFKTINDRFGHPVGDAVLKKACDVAAACLRAHDRIGRMGGEEFAVLMPSTTPAQAALVMERVRQAVGQFDWTVMAPELAVTFSAGISAAQQGETAEAIFKRADVALYRAKHSGRDRVICAEGEALQ
ncbi:MAG TPA: GGDEF domain-containing protein [Burkholderiaceae bacterium]